MIAQLVKLNAPRRYTETRKVRKLQKASNSGPSKANGFSSKLQPTKQRRI